MPDDRDLATTEPKVFRKWMLHEFLQIFESGNPKEWISHEPLYGARRPAIGYQKPCLALDTEMAIESLPARH
jgi:hypothetical protein